MANLRNRRGLAGSGPYPAVGTREANRDRCRSTSPRHGQAQQRRPGRRSVEPSNYRGEDPIISPASPKSRGAGQISEGSDRSAVSHIAQFGCRGGGLWAMVRQLSGTWVPTSTISLGRSCPTPTLLLFRWRYRLSSSGLAGLSVSGGTHPGPRRLRVGRGIG